MKKCFHKLGSVLMAFLLLASTISWTVGKHTCMGRVVNVALFADAADCGMAKASALMEDDGQHHCCDDEHITIIGQDDLKLVWNGFEPLSLSVVYTTWGTNVADQFVGLPAQRVKLPKYPPPKIPKDLVILYEVLLI